MNVPAIRFSVDDAQLAADAWAANCGPGAVAAICGMTLDELRPFLGDFERKRYTNPTLMWHILVRLGVTWQAARMGTLAWDLRETLWPRYGLARVQWEGPWTAPGVPMRARYRHTHWVGAAERATGLRIFDINCICVGGWVSADEWADHVVPWLLNECTPKANGHWHLTHVVEIYEYAPARKHILESAKGVEHA